MTEQFETRRRLMALLKNEMRMEQLEKTVAKESTKLHTKLATLTASIERQQREIEKLRAIVTQHREDIETRSAFTKLIRKKLLEEKQTNIELQSQLAKAKEERLNQMGCVRTLSDATNTYINPRALPSRVKGIAVLREEGRWIPFDYDADDIRGLSTFWAYNRSGSNSHKWHQLLTMDKPIIPTISDKENLNVSMSSIIEIDLTSPPPSNR